MRFKTWLEAIGEEEIPRTPEDALSVFGYQKIPSSMEELTADYRDKAKQTHPDQNPGATSVPFKRIQAAYELLSNAIRNGGTVPQGPAPAANGQYDAYSPRAFRTGRNLQDGDLKAIVDRIAAEHQDFEKSRQEIELAVDQIVERIQRDLRTGFIPGRKYLGRPAEDWGQADLMLLIDMLKSYAHRVNVNSQEW